MQQDEPICDLLMLLGTAVLVALISTFIFTNNIAAMEKKITKLEQQRGVPIDGKELKPGVYERNQHDFIAVRSKKVNGFQYYTLPQPRLERLFVNQVMFPQKDGPTWKLYYLDKEGGRGEPIEQTDWQNIDQLVMVKVLNKGDFWSLNDQIVIKPSKPKNLPIVYTLDSDVP